MLTDALFKSSRSVTLALLVALGLSAGEAFGRGEASMVYDPNTKQMQGDANVEFDESYNLSITATPADANTPLPSGIFRANVLFRVIAPSGGGSGVPPGVDEGEATGYISSNGGTLVWNIPALPPGSPAVPVSAFTQVRLNIPAGNPAGDYYYEIYLEWVDANGNPTSAPSGLLDQKGYINMSALQSHAVNVSISSPVDTAVYVYPVDTGVNFNVTASAPAGSPAINLVEAWLVRSSNGNIINLGAAQGFGPVVPAEQSVTRSGSMTIGPGQLISPEPGEYTFNVRATNTLGLVSTSNVSFEIMAPPEVSIHEPAGLPYVHTPGGADVVVPYSFTATSTNPGGLLSATLNFQGNGIGLDDPAGASSKTYGGNFVVSGPGNYSFTVTATDVLGTTTKTGQFTVISVAPSAIVTAATGSPTYTLATTADPAQVNFIYSAIAGNGQITSISAVLNASPDGLSIPVSLPAVPGNTASVSGSGTLSLLPAVETNYTLVVTATATFNGVSVTSSGSTTFTVKLPPPPPPPPPPMADCSVLWLPPVSLGKDFEGGSYVPIKFRLECPDDHKMERDESVMIAVYEVLPDGSAANLQVFPYGRTPMAGTYEINAVGQYHLNYLTANGEHTYRIEVYRFVNGSPGSIPMLGTREIYTKRGKR